jgi:hypothetical protein
MPDLARGVPRSVPQMTVEHRAGPDTRADEHREQALRAGSVPEAELAPCGAAHVVLDPDRDVERRRDLLPEGKVSPAEVRGGHDGLGLRVDLSCDGNADAGDTGSLVGELANGVLQGLEDGGGTATRLGPRFRLDEDATVVLDEPAADASATEVDPDGGMRDYAFFSSSFFAALVESSRWASLMPFLNSFTLEPSDRASSGSRLAPKSTSTITRISRSS